MTSENEAATPQQQLDDRDWAARAAAFAVDTFLIDHHAQLASVPRAVISRLTVEAALGYLIGQGLIKVLPRGEWPEYLEMQTPEHLVPDAAEAAAGNAAIRDALFGGGGRRG